MNKIFTLIAVFWASQFQVVYGQGWKLQYKPDQPVYFHMAQLNNEVMVAIPQPGPDMFIRVTDQTGKHTRYPFLGGSPVKIDLPADGYIALMSEDPDNRVLNVHASERVQQIRYVDEATFRRLSQGQVAASTGTAPVQRERTSSKPRVNLVVEGPVDEEVVVDRNGNILQGNPRGVTGTVNREFDPDRVKVAQSRPNAQIYEQGAPMMGRDREQENAAPSLEVTQLTSQLKEISQQLKALQHQVADLQETASKAPEAARPVFSPRSFVVGATLGYFNAANACDNCKIDHVVGAPGYLNMGIAFNGPRLTSMVLLSVGAQVHLPEPGPLRIRPAGGGKLVFVTDKYAISGSLSSTRNFDSMILTAGFGVPIGAFTPMIELGYFGGNMNLLASRQVTTAWSASLLYNMRKKLR